MKTQTVRALGLMCLVALIFIPLSPVMADPDMDREKCDKFYEIKQKQKESEGSPAPGIEKKMQKCIAGGWTPP